MHQEPIFIRPIKLPWYAWVLIPLFLVILLAAALLFLALFLVIFLPATLLARWLTGRRGSRYLVPGTAQNSSEGGAFPNGFGPFVQVFWNLPGLGQPQPTSHGSGREIPGELLVPSDTPPVESSLLLPESQTPTPVPPTSSQT